MPTALITGITGQDGSYLDEPLLEKEEPRLRMPEHALEFAKSEGAGGKIHSSP